MRQLARLLRYVVPYWWQFLASVVLMGAVGLLDAFRILLVGPILDRLAAAHPTRDVVVVSHGGVMMALWAHVTGVWDNAHVPPNCGIILIEHHSKGYMAPQIIGDGVSAKDAGG